MNDKVIYTTYSQVKTPDRDERVLDRINLYLSTNIQSLSDGIMRHTTTIAGDTRLHIEAPYNMSQGSDAWKTITKCREFNQMKKLASPLKLGLIVSYVDTRNVMFLNFFMILIYSSLMSKYFKNGYDRNIMKYTIDTADARTDFKKYEGSILMVVSKKVETFLNLYKSQFSKLGTPTDKQIREWCQSLTTRMNESVRGIAQKYYKNFNDPDVKIMIEYSQTDDGKQTVSASGVMEAVRQTSVNNLQAASDKILNMVGLPANNIGNLKYRRLLIEEIPNNFDLMSGLTSNILDEWMKRNKDKVSLPLFRQTFLKSMSAARGLNSINKDLDTLVFRMLETIPDENRKSYNKAGLRKYLYLYLLGNIYMSSKDIL